MATENRYCPLVPPKRVTIIRTSTTGGPSLHAIEHAVCCPDFDDLVNRALHFEIALRLFPGNDQIHGSVYCYTDVDIVVTALRRVDYSIVELGGHLRHECIETPRHISKKPTITIMYELKGRSNPPRTGSVEIARPSYLTILRINRNKFGGALILD